MAVTDLRTLARQAMLGTGAGFSLSQVEGVDLTGREPEAALLAAAGLVGTAEIGGQILPFYENPVLPSAEESRPYVPESAGMFLRRILVGEYPQLLTEFLTMVVERGQLVPPEPLPTLFGLPGAQVRSLIVRAAGARGGWLARQNPAWGFASVLDSQEAWENGSRAERLAGLTAIRSEDPARARAWVIQSWPQEAPEDRAAFVTAFSTNLSMQDEPFLEDCLDDRRKEVRSAARSLLLRLPESRLVQRAWGRAKPLLRYKTRFLGSPQFEVGQPAEPDPSARRDGIGEIAFPGKFGQQAGLLFQYLSQVPPAVWSQESGVRPGKLISTALACEWREPILWGWIQATLNILDAEWAGCFAIAWAQHPEMRTLLDKIDDLLQMAKMEMIQDFLAGEIKPGLSELRDETLISLLQNLNRPWPAGLARLVIGSIKRQSGNLPFSPAFALPGFARWVPADLAPEFLAGWAESVGGYAPENVYKFRAILEFRYAMLQSFEPGVNPAEEEAQ